MLFFLFIYLRLCVCVPFTKYFPKYRNRSRQYIDNDTITLEFHKRKLDLRGIIFFFSLFFPIFFLFWECFISRDEIPVSNDRPPAYFFFVNFLSFPHRFHISLKRTDDDDTYTTDPFFFLSIYKLIYFFFFLYNILSYIQ